MSEQNKLVAIPTSDYELEAVNAKELDALTQTIKDSVLGPNNSVLNKHAAAQMALITLTTGLSPFVGEIYFTKNGVQIGVVAYERKSKEYMEAYKPGYDYHIVYRKANQAEADFDPEKGDIAYVARLTRDDWDREWSEKLREYLQMFKEAGLDGATAYDKALEILGPKPFDEAVGVVDHRESFSWVYTIEDERKGKIPEGFKVGDAAPEMMDRHMRAKKRARMALLKHGFPRLNIPDPIQILGKLAAGRLIQEVAGPVVPPRVIDAPSVQVEGDLRLRPPDVPEDEYWTPEQIKAAKEGGIVNMYQAINTLKQSKFMQPGFTAPELVKRWVMARVAAKAAGHKDPSDKADNLYADWLADEEAKREQTNSKDAPKV